VSKLKIAFQKNAHQLVKTAHAATARKKSIFLSLIPNACGKTAHPMLEYIRNLKLKRQHG
jgi:hypothetical protein